MKHIQVVTCTGINNSTLDEMKVRVWKDYNTCPTKVRTYKCNPARAARIAKLLKFWFASRMNMEVCDWQYEHYTA